MIDALGGIQVTVPVTLDDPNYPADDERTTMHVHFDRGTQAMDGERALEYARSRLSTSEADRAARQELVMSAILWSSSLPVHIADRAVRRGNQRLLRTGLLAGFRLGATFLGMQVLVEYPKVLAEFHPSTNAYGSLFFTITGFHGFHVVVGLLISLWTQMRARQGAFDEHRHVTVQNFAMYWHFVDVVWLFVLLTVYISPDL